VVVQVLLIDIPGNTVKLVEELTDIPPARLILIGPVVLPDGTIAVIWVGVFTTKEADLPLNAIEEIPLKLAPVIMTVVPAAPLIGEKRVMEGVGVTAKTSADVAIPPAVVILILPLVAPVGTMAVI
jgi:hypothetical protein